MDTRRGPRGGFITRNHNNLLMDHLKHKRRKKKRLGGPSGETSNRHKGFPFYLLIELLGWRSGDDLGRKWTGRGVSKRVLQVEEKKNRGHEVIG